MECQYHFSDRSRWNSCNDPCAGLKTFRKRRTGIFDPIVGLFVTYFCGPAMTVLIPIAIVFLFKKQHKKFSLIVFLCALADIISSGGRIQIIYIVSQLIAAFLL